MTSRFRGRDQIKQRNENNECVWPPVIKRLHSTIALIRLQKDPTAFGVCIATQTRKYLSFAHFNALKRLQKDPTAFDVCIAT